MTITHVPAPVTIRNERNLRTDCESDCSEKAECSLPVQNIFSRLGVRWNDYGIDDLEIRREPGKDVRRARALAYTDLWAPGLWLWRGLAECNLLGFGTPGSLEGRPLGEGAGIARSALALLTFAHFR